MALKEHSSAAGEPLSLTSTCLVVIRSTTSESPKSSWTEQGCETSSSHSTGCCRQTCHLCHLIVQPVLSGSAHLYLTSGWGRINWACYHVRNFSTSSLLISWVTRTGSWGWSRPPLALWSGLSAFRSRPRSAHCCRFPSLPYSSDAGSGRLGTGWRTMSWISPYVVQLTEIDLYTASWLYSGHFAEISGR